MKPLLEVRDLRTYFDTYDGVVKAVDGVSYHLDEGETLGIVGESGSGKSVGSLTVMGLLPSPPARVVSGEVFFEGRDLLKLNKEEMRRIRGKSISMVFQDPMTSLNPVLTIGRQVSEAIELHLGMNKAESRNRTVELLEMVGIPEAGHRLGAYPHQFSGGMRQRVMIAMALSCNPKLLIADEPTTALDVTIQAQILQLLRDLTSRLGTSVILITHNFGLVAGFVDRVMVMYAGLVMEQASTIELFHNPQHPYTQGLFRSIPRLDEEGERLVPIKGLPPDLRYTPPGCPFNPRCPHVQEKCQQRPPLRPIADGHAILCWFDIPYQRVL
ncbi:MAG: ABC transporter ATP-binding protein [Dehalococcoidia bacterium]|nr:ABC transporter ATP-binding protein [Dehalococcoidia bacterium]